ncbi:hypothetical protein SSX86_006212 [Deinandra increscens subsp. villosa]|uniref:Tudor domain-containing protein n=1 Tax=Deinandra increscens subsp. villosa TaxID=3103831 RepID=A0AAP0DVB6_9ASTR
MTSIDALLEQQLKKAGKQLSLPWNSVVDELLRVLDQLEKLLLRVDQSPKQSMLDALKPSMNALIHDSLSKHSDIDVKVSVASCISEITRITAPEPPYTDDQMRDVFQLIVSSFENLDDKSSRSYNKRASILDTVSKVRSCVIMLDLECDELIVKMFEIFLKSVRDFHLDSVFSAMENIMVVVIEESGEISVELLKPLLATVRKNREGVLSVAHKLGKGVLLKSADKLKPYMIPALTSLGELLDIYHEVVAAVCEGTTANFQNNDDNDSGLQLANECKLEKGSLDEAPQVAKEEVCVEEVETTVEKKSPKSVMSNGVNVTVKEEVSVDQESKKPEKDKSQESLGKEDTDASVGDKLVKDNSETEKTSPEPFDKENDNDSKELDNEIERDNNVEDPAKQNEEDNDVKESENEAAIPSQTEKDKDTVEEFTPKAIESEPAASANVSSPSQSNNGSDGRSVSPNQKPVPQEDETASPSKSESLPDETLVKKVGLPEDKGLTQEDTTEAQNQAGMETVIPNEVKLPDTVNKAEDGEASSDPETELLKNSSKSTKQKLPDIKNQSEDGDAGSDSDAKLLRKSTKSTKQKLPETVKESEEGKTNSDSDAKLLKESSKSTNQSGKKSNPSDKKLDVGESDAKKAKQSGKKVEVKGEESDSYAKPLKMSVKKGEKSQIDLKEEEGSDSDGKPLNLSATKSISKKKVGVSGSDAKSPKLYVKKGEKSKIAVEEEEESDSDGKPLNLAAKKSTSKKKVDVSGSDAKSLKLSVKKGEKSKIAVEEEESDSDGKPPNLSAKKSTSKKKVDVKGEESGSDAKPLKMSVKKGEKSKIAAEEEKEQDSDNKPVNLSAKKSTSKKKDDGKKRGNEKNVTEKDQAKSLSGDDEMDISPKSATKSAKSAKGEGNSTKTPVTSAKRKHDTGKDEVTIKYDESLIGTKVKVWWPEDKMYYEGVVDKYYPDKKKHKISYVDGDTEVLSLKTQKWEILEEFSVCDDKGQNTQAQIEEASPEIHKKKKSKTVLSASQEKIKDSAKKVGGVSSSGKSKGSTPKDFKSTQKTSSKSSDAAVTTSKQTEKSKEDEETLKTISKTKTVNKSKGITSPSGSKSNTNAPIKAKAKSGSSDAKEPEGLKSAENTKDGSKSGKKRKNRT